MLSDFVKSACSISAVCLGASGLIVSREGYGTFHLLTRRNTTAYRANGVK